MSMLKIVRSPEDSVEIRFDTLSIGEVFEWEKSIYIKIQEASSNINCFRVLSCGVFKGMQATTFSGNCKVIPVDGKLIINK